MTKKINLLLSTDIGTDIDDAIALYLAMNSEIINLSGVYVTNGPVDGRAGIAKHMLALAGYYDTLVAIGEERALFTKLPLFTTGAEIWTAPQSERRGPPYIVKNWPLVMLKQLEGLADVVVASIAPLTNIAVLLEKKPDAVARIKTLYMMGGRTGENEHNFSHDALAAQNVLGSQLDIVIVPADVCKHFTLDISYLTTLKNWRAQRYLAHMASLWKLYHDTNKIFTQQFLKLVEEEGKLFLKVLRMLGRQHGEIEKDNRTFEHYAFSLMLLCNGYNFKDNPIEQLRIYNNIVDLSRKHTDKTYAKFFLEHINKNELKSIYVSDAFIIYAIENPDKVEIKNVTADCDNLGRMSIRDGGRHKLVTKVNYTHFEHFLKDRLSKPPQPNLRKERVILR